MSHKYKYPGVWAEFYDLVHSDKSDDKTFYLNEISKVKGPIFEIGCGTGRIFVAALKKGADIYGIDLSEEMLGKLYEKIDVKDRNRVRAVNALDYVSDKKFELIIVPFRMFQHLVTVDEQLKFLSNVKENLKPNGKLIFDIFRVVNMERIVTSLGEGLRFEGQYAPGKIFRWYDSAKPDLFNQCQHVTFRFEWTDENGSHEDETYFTMRYMFRFEIEHLIARAGLKLEHLYGDFKCGELNEQSPNFIVICSNPEDK